MKREREKDRDRYTDTNNNITPWGIPITILEKSEKLGLPINTKPCKSCIEITERLLILLR